MYYIVQVESKFHSNSIMSVFGHLSKYYLTICGKQSAPKFTITVCFYDLSQINTKMF